jgi:hypothetical protein
MPIGDQDFAGTRISAGDLRRRYDDLIKEALFRADSELDITRADDVATPGTITSDILTRIMHSDLVVADVTYPNPNVFYELGLRHACRTGTIIIRDKSGPRAPFDISHLRYVEYENTPSGLKALEASFRQYIDHFAKRPEHPDNHMLELAKLTKYEFPRYGDQTDEGPELAAFMAAMQTPALMDLIVRQGAGEKVDPGALMSALATNPQSASTIIKALVKSGKFNFSGSASAPAAPARAERRAVQAQAKKNKPRR